MANKTLFALMFLCSYALPYALVPLCSCAHIAGYLCPLRYPGLINHLFSLGSELRRVVLNLGNLDFDIVSDLLASATAGRYSDFVFRRSRHLYNCREIITFVERALQISYFIMQNEPNFGKAQMNVNKVLTKDYENISNWTLGENEPKTNPIKPNFKGKKNTAGRY